MGCNMSKDEVPERKLEHLADSMVIMTSKGKKEDGKKKENGKTGELTNGKRKAEVKADEA